jgi:PRTRC genetic system protein C
MANTRKYYFGNEPILVDANLTPEQVRSAWGDIHPDVLNASIHENADGSITFRRSGGTKG